jgi:CDP-diacylglycerol--serine O-phosphatidyltransferase
MLRRPHMHVRVRVRPPHFSLNRMIPNILTLLALCAGMTGIRLAIVGKYEAAVTAIIVAGILDGLDGRIARLLKGTSSFGAQLDSLSDFVSFGVAPAVMLYVWTMAQLQGFGWAVVLIFAVCCGLRLARFNTQIGADLPPYAYNFFTGAPAPAGAGLVMLPMIASFEFGGTFFRSPYLNTIVIAAVAALMVSRVPTVAVGGRARGVPHHRALAHAPGGGHRIYRFDSVQHPLLRALEARSRRDAQCHLAGRQRSQRAKRHQRSVTGRHSIAKRDRPCWV